MVKPQRTGPERVRHEWREFRKAALFWAVSGGLLLVLSALVGDVERAQPLLGHIGMLTLVLGIRFVAGPAATSIARGPYPSPPRTPGGGPTSRPRPRRDQSSTERGSMTEQQQIRQESATSNWAPWWRHVVVILGVNYLRQMIMPVGIVPEWAVVLIVLGISAALFVATTAVYRAARTTTEGGNAPTSERPLRSRPCG